MSTKITISHDEVLRTAPPWPGATYANTMAVLLARKGLRLRPSFNPTPDDLLPPWRIDNDNASKGFTICQGEPPLIQEVSATLSARLAAEVDDALRAAITRHLGRSDWTLDEFRGRLSQHGDWVRGATYYLDEKPLLRLRPKPQPDLFAEPTGVIEVGFDLEHL